jgi:hypothetical protein
MSDFEHQQPGPLRPPRPAEPTPAPPTFEQPYQQPQAPPAQQPPLPPQQAGPPRRRLAAPRIRVGAVVVLAIAAGFVAWLVLRDRGSSTAQPSPPSSAQATAASPADLRSLADSLGHPIFWVGEKSGDTYELTQTQNGKVYIRYLPAGVAVGSDKPYLTVATYPFPGAFAAIQEQVRAKGAVSVKLPQGGLALLDSGYPQSVHVAYPGVDYQIEVFDPTPAAAMQTVAAGHLEAIGSLKTDTTATPTATPTAVAPAGLKSIAASLGHPIYWAGPRRGYTYELTQTSTGSVYIRYLPPSVPVGAKDAYLTVATYPFPDALAAVQRAAKGNKAGTIKLSGGGLAVVDLQYPKSVHLAFPKSDVQVEVFDPSPAQARRVVSSGKIVAVP